MSTKAVAAPAFDPQHARALARRDLLSIRDFNPQELAAVLDLTALIKAHPADFCTALAGKQVVMFFEKPSLRTRITFEAGIAAMGGTTFFVDQTRSRLGEREPLEDIARNLERWVDAVVLRTFEHATIAGIADNASIPVVNALSELEHPCQALADFFTLQEKFGDLKKIRLAYVGDGNNVAHSLMLAGAALGSSVIIGCPRGYEPDKKITAQAQAAAREMGGAIKVTNDPAKAVRGANAIYTDVWASMGQESEARKRARIFAPFQVNGKLMSKAAPDAVFMHCLPAHRGEEVTAEVLESPQSVVFDQAENRLHVQKSILLLLMGGELRRNPRRANA